jgi:hypothetical protein
VLISKMRRADGNRQDRSGSRSTAATICRRRHTRIGDAVDDDSGTELCEGDHRCRRPRLDHHQTERPGQSLGKRSLRRERENMASSCSSSSPRKRTSLASKGLDAVPVVLYVERIDLWPPRATCETYGGDLDYEFRPLSD